MSEVEQERKKSRFGRSGIGEKERKMFECLNCLHLKYEIKFLMKFSTSR